MDNLRWVRASALICVLLPAITACAGAEAERPGFTVIDSAGVVLVRNPAEPPPDTFRLEPNLRIGVIDTPIEYQFGSIASIAEGSGGEIYVLDDDAFTVRVYDADGSYVRTLGRQGEGPGEFARPEVIRVGAGDTLYVLENQFFGGRLHAFAPDGTPLRMHTFRLPGNIGSEWRISPRGDALIEMSRATRGLADLLLRVDGHTGVLDTVAVLEPATPSEFPVVFAAEPYWAVLSDGRVAIGRSDAYRFELFGAGGTAERVVTREATPIEIPEAAKEAAIESRRRLFDRPPPMPAGVPREVIDQQEERRRQQSQNTTSADHYPLYADVMAGPRGTLWVRRPILPGERREGVAIPFTWDVFDADGQLRGLLQFEPSFPPPTVSGEHVYRVVRDDLGVEYVERLRIDWGDGG